MPKVSVLIPSYNHEKFIAESIQSALRQSYQDFEIVIVDDGSSDGSVEEIKRFDDKRIRLYCFQENRGAAVAMRTLLDEARGDYISVLSSDDLFVEDKLEKQLGFLNSHPEIGAVFSYAEIIDEDGNEFSDKEHPFCHVFVQENRSRFEWLNQFFYKWNCLCHPSVLIRRECYDHIGYYDERFAQLPDFDLWVRLCMKYEIHIMPENLIKFRIREGEKNVSGRRPETVTRSTLEYMEILKNYLHIRSAEDFGRIFPGYSDHNQIEEEFIPFHVAMLASQVNFPSHLLFAISTLFGLFNHKKMAEQIERKCHFAYIDLIRLTGKYDILNQISMLQCSKRIESLDKENKALKEERDTMRLAIEEFARLRDAVESVAERMSRQEKREAFLRKIIKRKDEELRRYCQRTDSITG